MAKFLLDDDISSVDRNNSMLNFDNEVKKQKVNKGISYENINQVDKS